MPSDLMRMAPFGEGREQCRQDFNFTSNILFLFFYRERKPIPMVNGNIFGGVENTGCLLRGISGSVPNCRNKANTAIKEVR